MIIIDNPKKINFRKLHLELLPYLGKMELSGDVLTIEVTDETAAMHIYNAHDPETPIVINEAVFEKPIRTPAVYTEDIFVSTPKIKDDPELALDEAIAEMKKGTGSEKSIALIVLSVAKYLEAKRTKLR